MCPYGGSLSGVKYLLGAVVGLMAVLWSASPALGAATMTYPANGATVRLDQTAGFNVRWTLPPGEKGPQVWVGDSPTYDPETFYPFDQGCGAQQPDDVTYSCHMGPPLGRLLVAGIHYAFIQTDDGDPTTQCWYSPVTRFVVPPELAWGCGPKAPCNDPAVSQTYRPMPTLGPPESDMTVRLWVNSPGAPASAKFTIRNGNRVVAVIRRNTRVESDFFWDPGFMVFQVGERGPYRSAVRLHGIKGVKWLRVTVVVRARGLRITRHVKFRAPPG